MCMIYGRRSWQADDGGVLRAAAAAAEAYIRLIYLYVNTLGRVKRHRCEICQPQDIGPAAVL